MPDMPRINGKWSAFIVCFSHQRPLKALYSVALHSPVHAHVHTPTAVCQPRNPTASSSGAVRGSALPPEPHAAH